MFTWSFACDEVNETEAPAASITMMRTTTTMTVSMWKANHMKSMSGPAKRGYEHRVCSKVDIQPQVSIFSTQSFDFNYLKHSFDLTGLQTSSHQANEDEDEDLNVDGDDAQIYGEPQYNERDIILPMADNNKKENIYLRNLVIGGPSSSDNGDSRLKASQIDNKNGFDDAMEPTTSTSYENPSPSFAETEINCESTASSSKITIDLKDGSVKEVTTVVPIKQLSSTSATQNETAAAHVIEALKEKIREYEIIIKNKSKCLICMDEFRVPVVSICCWHVHCEECWLRTLGARKLCPQCNMITSPTDLRKIYM